jgi:hypothetical protein
VTARQLAEADPASSLYALGTTLAGSALPYAQPRVHGAFKPSSEVLSWQNFGISYHQYTGRRNNVTFQAHVWLRLLCQQHMVQAQLVTAWSELPYNINSPWGNLWFPNKINYGSAYPRILFQNATELDSTVNVEPVEVQYRDKDGVTVCLTGEAALALGTTYVLSIEGVDTQHEVSTTTCSLTHPVFQGEQPSWVFAADHFDRTLPKEFPWLVAEHARHHRCLGMHGLILNTTPSRARRLIQHPDISRAMQRGELVLITWVRVLRGSCNCVYTRGYWA